ncbi:hypothetical protein HRbin20_01736 [bacterium HR20]|nr:hypothetical protein HRbin20_01736 [bacterium HR20]
MFEDKINDGIEQGMSGANERGERFARKGDKFFFEGDALVAVQDGLADSDEPVPLADSSGHMRDFVATWFALVNRSAKLAECLQEERFDVVRLEAASCGTFHILANALQPFGVDDLLCQSTLFYQVLQMRRVQGLFDGLTELHFDFGPFAVADCLDEQVAERPALELQFAQHVEDLATEGGASLFELLEQSVVNVALASLDCHHVPQVAGFGLADTVDAAKALFDTVGVPGQVVVDHEVCALEIDAFAGSIGCHEHAYLRIVEKGLLCFAPVFTAHGSVDEHHCLLAQQCCDALDQVVQGVSVFGEDDEFLIRRTRSEEEIVQEFRQLAPFAVLAA